MTTTTALMTPQEQFIAKTLAKLPTTLIQDNLQLIHLWEEYVLENYDPEEDSETGTYSLLSYVENTIGHPDFTQSAEAIAAFVYSSSF